MRFQGPRLLRCAEHGTYLYTAIQREYHLWLRHRQGGARFEEWDRCAACSEWLQPKDAERHVCRQNTEDTDDRTRTN